MTDEGTDDMLDNDDGQRQPDRKGPYRMDALSAGAGRFLRLLGAACFPEPYRMDALSTGAGLLFIAIAIVAQADRFWAEVDPVLVGGGAAVAVGVGMIVGVIRRGWRERGPVDG